MSMRPDDHRKKWDKKEYERKALDRIQKIEKTTTEVKEAPRELLKTREYKVDLESKLGKSVVLNKTAPNNGQSGGYFCNVCDCVVKDSINFLDHINGKKHQRNLGMSMKVERSSLDQVRERFNRNKTKIEERKDKPEYNLDSQVKNLEKEEEERRQQKKNRKRKHDDESTAASSSSMGFDDEMARMMGFGGFGGSKKNN